MNANKWTNAGMPMTKSKCQWQKACMQINEWINEQMHRWQWQKANAYDKKHECKWVNESQWQKANVCNSMN